MLKIEIPIIVEGRYDKSRILQILKIKYLLEVFILPIENKILSIRIIIILILNHLRFSSLIR